MRITSKRHVTIPVASREKLGPLGKSEFELEAGLEWGPRRASAERALAERADEIERIFRCSI